MTLCLDLIPNIRKLLSLTMMVCYYTSLFCKIILIFTEILLGFERAEYAFNESAGSLPESVYIVRENPVTVSSEFNITVLLLSQSTATDSKCSVVY